VKRVEAVPGDRRPAELYLDAKPVRAAKVALVTELCGRGHFEGSAVLGTPPSTGPRGTGTAEGPIQRTREGGSEWEPIKIVLERDGDSNKMYVASNTLLQLTTQVCQSHVATGVPLDLGTNTQPFDPRTQRNTKPRVYRPTPVRPVRTTGQTGPCW
jgi:hypothetical protein